MKKKYYFVQFHKKTIRLIGSDTAHLTFVLSGCGHGVPRSFETPLRHTSSPNFKNSLSTSKTIGYFFGFALAPEPVILFAAGSNGSSFVWLGNNNSNQLHFNYSCIHSIPFVAIHIIVSIVRVMKISKCMARKWEEEKTKVRKKWGTNSISKAQSVYIVTQSNRSQ